MVKEIEKLVGPGAADGWTSGEEMRPLYEGPRDDLEAMRENVLAESDDDDTE